MGATKHRYRASRASQRRTGAVCSLLCAAVAVATSVLLHLGCSSDAGQPSGASGVPSSGDAGGDGPDAALDGASDSAASGACGSAVCQSDEFCNWTDDKCGEESTAHQCAPKSSVCAKDRPICGCDEVAYPNECEAIANGTDRNLSTGCAGEIEGWFHCGPGTFCRRFEEACSEEGDDMSGITSYGCVPLPPCESGTPICDCIKAIPCMFSSFNHYCTDYGNGAVIESCSF